MPRVGVPSRLGTTFCALGVTALMGGPPGVPTLIGSAVDIGVEGESNVEVGGGKAVAAGGTDCDFRGLLEEGVEGGGAAAEPGRGGCFGGGSVAFVVVGSSLAA